MALQTLTQLKLQIGLSGTNDDALLQELQAAAEDFIKQHCGRDFDGGEFTEFHRSGTKYLFVKNFPIASVASIRLDPERQFPSESTLDPSRYVVLPDVGLIESLDRSFLNVSEPNAVKIVYSTTSTVPSDVLRAQAELVNHWFRQTKTSAAVEHLNVKTRTDGTVVTEYPWGQSGGFRIPSGVLQLLKNHRVPTI
jgi:hypothetical protein